MATSIDNLGVQFRAIAAGKWDVSKAQNNIFYSVEHVDSNNRKTYDLYLGSQLLSNQDEVNAAVARIGQNEQSIQALQTLTAGFGNSTIKAYVDNAITALDSGALANRVAANEAAITKINKETIPNAITTAGTKADSKISAFKTSTVDPLAATVGNASSGLVKKVADLETTTGSHTTKIGKLEAAVNTLNGPASTTGSVRQIAANEINTLINAADPDGGATIANIQALVEYVDDNAGDIAALVQSVGTNTTNITNIISGDQPVGKAATLDGHDANYFAVKETVNSQLGAKVNKTDVYTKTEVNTELNKKANLADVYTDDAVDALLAEKADKGTTLEDYGITDAYKKTETYTQSEVQAQATSAANTAKNALRTELLGSAKDNDSTAPPTIYSVKNYATNVAAAALSGAKEYSNNQLKNALTWQALSSM